MQMNGTPWKKHKICIFIFFFFYFTSGKVKELFLCEFMSTLGWQRLCGECQCGSWLMTRTHALYRFLTIFISFVHVSLNHYSCFVWRVPRDYRETEKKPKLTDIWRISNHTSVASITVVANKFRAVVCTSQPIRLWNSCCIYGFALCRALVLNTRRIHDILCSGAPVVPPPHRCCGEYSLLWTVPGSGENVMQQFTLIALCAFARLPYAHTFICWFR